MKELWTDAFRHASGSFDFMTVLYAFLAAIALLAVMRKAGLMRREAAWHNALVRVYYLYIPLLFVGGAVAWSAVGSAESSMLSTIDRARPAITRTTLDYAGAAWAGVTENFRANPTVSLREICLTTSREYAGKLLDGLSGVSRFTLFMQPLVDTIQEGVAQSLAAAVEEEILKTVSDAARLDRAALKNLWTGDLVGAIQGGIVCDILASQARRAFSPAYQYIRMVFILLLLPVILEMAFSLYWRKRSAA